MVALPFSQHQISVKKPFSNNKYTKEPKTLGEHLRNKRIELRLLQKDVALLFKVGEDCITNWENGRAIPQIQFYPYIISFLGFNPFISDTSTLGGKIKQYRYEHGLSHKALGKLLNVDATTVGAWEAEECNPHSETLKKIEKLFGTINSDVYNFFFIWR